MFYVHCTKHSVIKARDVINFKVSINLAYQMRIVWTTYSKSLMQCKKIYN